MRQVTYNHSYNAVSPTYTLTRFLRAILYIVEGLLALRFALRLLGAGTVSAFADFVYTITNPLVAPFANIVRSTTTTAAPGSIDWTTVIAMVVYWLLALAVINLILAATRTGAKTTTFTEYTDRDGNIIRE